MGLANYGHVLGASVWWADVLHTVIITVVAVSFQFVLGMLLAIAMHRTTVVRGLLRSVGLVPYAIVAVMAAYSWQYAFSLNSGWIPQLLGLGSGPLSHTFGGYVAIIFTEAWKNTPFMALLLLAGWRLCPMGRMRQRASTAPLPGSASSESRCRYEAGDPRRAAVRHAR